MRLVKVCTSSLLEDLIILLKKYWTQPKIEFLPSVSQSDMSCHLWKFFLRGNYLKDNYTRVKLAVECCRQKDILKIMLVFKLKWKSIIQLVNFLGQDDQIFQWWVVFIHTYKVLSKTHVSQLNHSRMQTKKCSKRQHPLVLVNKKCWLLIASEFF